MEPWEKFPAGYIRITLSRIGKLFPHRRCYSITAAQVGRWSLCGGLSSFLLKSDQSDRLQEEQRKLADTNGDNHNQQNALPIQGNFVTV
jgi:hypothetical protein